MEFLNYLLWKKKSPGGANIPKIVLSLVAFSIIEEVHQAVCNPSISFVETWYPVLSPVFAIFYSNIHWQLRFYIL